MACSPSCLSEGGTDAEKMLGNLANTKRYEYSDDDVKMIFHTLEGAIAGTKRLFARRTRRDFRH
jgi:hypothetical protein